MKALEKKVGQEKKKDSNKDSIKNHNGGEVAKIKEQGYRELLQIQQHFFLVLQIEMAL